MKSSFTNPSNNTTMSTFEPSITTTTTTTIPFHNNVTHKRRGKTPSFSSILLDAIYRSIDDTYTDTDSASSSQPNHTPKTATSTTTTTTSIKSNHDSGQNNARGCDYVQASKQRRTKMRSDSTTLETIELRHAIMIDSWMEKQPSSQQPQPQPQPQPRRQGYYHNVTNNNAADDSNIKFVRQKSVPNKSSNIGTKICNNIAHRSADSCLRFDHHHAPKREASSRIFNKTKLKALKIYSDLKKSKQQQQQQQQQQPVSPGARIAAFLNSIFRNTTAAPPRRSPENPASTTTSACSSASSFSRSCLSKSTASTSTEKSKRSVRFCPTSTSNSTVIADERDDTHTLLLCEKNKPHNDDNRIVDDQKLPAASDHQQSRKWKREKEIDALMMMIKRNRSGSHDDYKEVLTLEMDSDDEMMNVDDDEEDDDGESCASSDLFELENFSSIGVSRFNQELPVYGTTSLKKLTS